MKYTFWMNASHVSYLYNIELIGFKHSGGNLYKKSHENSVKPSRAHGRQMNYKIQHFGDPLMEPSAQEDIIEFCCCENVQDMYSQEI
jgi:hypothetical protein